MSSKIIIYYRPEKQADGMLFCFINIGCILEARGSSRSNDVSSMQSQRHAVASASTQKVPIVSNTYKVRVYITHYKIFLGLKNALFKVFFLCLNVLKDALGSFSND